MENKKKIVLIVFAMLCVLVAALASRAEGQRRVRTRISDELLLAHVTIHEAGWDDRGDMAAIDAVFRAGAARESLSYRAYAAAYSGRIWSGETSKPWVRHITEECTAPAEWPAFVVHRTTNAAGEEEYVRVPHASWRTYRERCLAVMERAREVRAGTRVHHCASDPHDWGGAIDHERAARIGLIPIDCASDGGTPRNTFYLRPSLEGREERARAPAREE